MGDSPLQLFLLFGWVCSCSLIWSLLACSASIDCPTNQPRLRMMSCLWGSCICSSLWTRGAQLSDQLNCSLPSVQAGLASVVGQITNTNLVFLVYDICSSYQTQYKKAECHSSIYLVSNTNLFEYWNKDVAFSIHEVNLATALAVVVVDAVHHLALGIENSAPISIKYERFSPHGISTSTCSSDGRAARRWMRRRSLWKNSRHDMGGLLEDWWAGLDIYCSI